MCVPEGETSFYVNETNNFFNNQRNFTKLPPSFICDPNGYLSKKAYVSMNQNLTRYFRKTDIEIAVLIVDVWKIE